MFVRVFHVSEKALPGTREKFWILGAGMGRTLTSSRPKYHGSFLWANWSTMAGPVAVTMNCRFVHPARGGIFAWLKTVAPFHETMNWFGVFGLTLGLLNQSESR